MNRSSRRAWLRAEGDADSLPPPDEFMGCDIISQGSLCSKERRRRLLALLMKQFIRWGWSYCMLPRQAGGGGGARWVGAVVGGSPAGARLAGGRGAPSLPGGLQRGCPLHALSTPCWRDCACVYRWPALPAAPVGAGSIVQGRTVGLSSAPSPGHPQWVCRGLAKPQLGLVPAFPAAGGSAAGKGLALLLPGGHGDLTGVRCVGWRVVTPLAFGKEQAGALGLKAYPGCPLEPRTDL